MTGTGAAASGGAYLLLSPSHSPTDPRNRPTAASVELSASTVLVLSMLRIAVRAPSPNRRCAGGFVVLVLMSDIRFILRGFRRTPGFVAAVVLTLALGLGANAAMFSVVDALLVRSLDFHDPERLMSVWGNAPAEYAGVREMSHSFVQVAAVGPRGFSLSDDTDAPERIDGAAVSANLFTTLGIVPTIGRGFDAEDNEPGRRRVVLVGHGLWQRRYGGERSVIGRAISIDGVSHEIIGVLPATYRYPSPAAQLFTPMVIDRADPGAYWIGDYRVIGRLRPGVTPLDARNDVRALGRELRRQNPLWDPGPEYAQQGDVVPLQRAMTAGVRPTLLVLLGVVSLVLLIACANVALLLLARANARSREFTIRAALGGGRARLIRQLVTESMMLAAAGALVGLLLAWVSLQTLTNLLPADVPRTGAIGIDWRVVGYAALLAAMTGLVFGIGPAIRASRTTLHSALGDGGDRTSGGVENQRASNSLVAGQMALAVILVIGAQLMSRSLFELMRVDPGFRSDQLVSAKVSPPQQRYRDDGRTRALYAQLFDRLRARPELTNVAAIRDLPLASTNYGMALRVEGKFEDVKHTLPMATHEQSITPGFLRAMSIPLVRGRDVAETDDENAPTAVLVSEALASTLWPGEDAIGKRVGAPYPSPWWTVVGVVGDVRHDSLSGPLPPTIYRAFRQAPAAGMSIVARTTGGSRALEAALRGAIAELDPTIPVSEIRTVDDVVAASLARQRFTMLLVAGFAVLAASLGALGIYGVMSYLVSQRQREIGVRMALGASPHAIQRDVIVRAIKLAAVGALIGVAGSFASTRLLTGLLYGISPTDPFTFANVPLLFVAIAIIASWLPARRAMRSDPARVLRG